MKLIAQGAEAKIYEENNTIVKERFEKKYRISNIDSSLRKFRTKREARVTEKINRLGFAPKLIKADKDKMRLFLERLKGEKLRDILDENEKLAIQIGENLAKMHDNSMIHGDLTTSNMILSKKKVYFIDFGLSFFSEKEEHKSVDIHLFKQAIESAHYKAEKRIYSQFLKGYKKSKNSAKVLKRLEIVEKRGRHKQKNIKKH